MTETIPRDRWRSLLLIAIVIIPIGFNAVALWPEVSRPIPSINDEAFHYLMIHSASEAIDHGENLLDSWGPEMDLGVPRFLYYQNLPATFIVVLDRLTFRQVGLLNLLNITRYLLMVGLPLTVYWSMRRMNFSPVAAAGGAAASSLLSGAGRYGIEYDSFVWRGWGMYTMEWAIHLSFITMACLWRLARTGRGAISTILAASVLVVSHLLYAEMMVITGGVVFLFGVDRSELKRRIPQFALVGALIALATSYLWFTYLQSWPYVGESYYDDPIKLNSYGAPLILDWLTSGDLFDHGRWPVFTATGAIGLLSLPLLRGRHRLLAVALFGAWLVLYFGRSIWGPIADAIPAGTLLLFHRFLGSLHIAGVLLIGMGFELVWRIITQLPRRAATLVAAAACTLLLVPPILERQAYYEPNTLWMGQTAAASAADTDGQTILATLRALPPGRVYAGLRANWGERMRVDQVPWYRVLLYEGFSVVSVPLPTINLNSDLMFHFNDQDAAAYDLFDVRYVLAPNGLPMPPFLTLLVATGKYALYRTPTSGVAEFARSTIRRNAATKYELFIANRTWLLGTDPGTRSFVRWDYPAPPPAVTPIPESGCTSDGTISNEIDGLDRIDLIASCPAAATLVIKSTYHPNWHVSVDGSEQPTFMVSPSYIGVDLAPGQHRVHVEYRSSWLRSGLLALGLLAIAGVVEARGRSPFLRTMLR